MAIALTTFYNVQSGVKYLRSFENSSAYKDSLLASCMIGFLVVLFWVVFSFFILLGRFFGSIAMGFGMLLGSCSHTGFFMLLAGLVLQTHENLASSFKDAGIWSSNDYSTYVATFAFNYILTGMYFLMFIVLLFTAKDLTGGEREAAYDAGPKPSKSAGAGKEMTPPAAASGMASGPTFASTVDNNHGFGTNWPNHGQSFRGGQV
ncbi:hypothetical protein HYH03_004965 [Edaphochlamys debaryana]|uniref:Uncharacterized protein n=1 Tax=Edaphochlamys debaryana TaxID=47281 RepID=A0A836C2T3_9CHLO|nr:hypothetical protein HYH03_004965 [Edaphochlamys debaryana]|eukprot:KAG2496959.1 hypothetical protein HYH03_004965 [Edaphochlamys debaryana]